MTEQSDNTDLPSAEDLLSSGAGLNYTLGRSRPRSKGTSAPDLDPTSVPTDDVDSELAKLPGDSDTGTSVSSARPWSRPSKQESDPPASQPAPPAALSKPDTAAAESESQDEPAWDPPLFPAEPAAEPAAGTPLNPSSENFSETTAAPETPAPAVEDAEASAVPTGTTQKDHSTFLTRPPQPPRPETAGDLAEARVLRSTDGEPTLHRVVRKATFGLITLGESPAQVEERRFTALAQTTIPDHHRIAVMSLKGGSGKTSTVTGLGHTLATLRGDHVVAMDANPDRGTLSGRVGTQHEKTVRNLLEYEDEHGITSLPHLKQFLSQSLPSRLFVLASDKNAAASQAFSAQDYHTTARILERFLPLGLTDCGTGLLFDALSGEGGVLDMADQVVVVCGPSVDEAQSASATLDFLEQHRWKSLASNAVVAMTKVPDAKTLKRSPLDLDEIEAHFVTRVRHTVRIPHDKHIAEGGRLELDKLAPNTRRAFLTLAAMVGEQFNAPVRVPQH